MDFTPLATDAQGLARVFPTLAEEDSVVHDKYFGSAKWIGKPYGDEILALIRSVYTGGTTPRAVGRNRIINGTCEHDQRRQGVAKASAASGDFLGDRFPYFKAGGSLTAVHTIQTTTDVPLVADFTREGRAYFPFTNSLLVDCTTIDTATTSLVNIRHVIEGYNIKDIIGDSYNFGFTLGFWHKHTKTGQNCVRFTESGSRSYIAEYTQTVSDRWEFAMVTVTAVPTGGTWNKTNGAGLYIDWTVEGGSASGVIGAAGSWLSVNAYATTNQVNNCDNTANNFRICGVQLEIGTVATPFEYVPSTTRLQLCQRYCYVPGYPATGSLATGPNIPIVGTGVINSAANAVILVPLPVQMRAAPVPGVVAAQWLIVDGITNPSLTAMAVAGFSGTALQLNCSLTGTTGRPAFLVADSGGGRLLILDSEL